MSTPSEVPEVSLITSWLVGVGGKSGGHGKPTTLPLGVMNSVQEGVSVLDLYFLDHSDVAWYAQAKKRNPGRSSAITADVAEPHFFAAHLSIDELDVIADRITRGLSESYEGRAIGRRPRIVAMATYFPAISTPDTEGKGKGVKRETAVKALRNAVYLASRLGARCVEIVGGARVPGLDAGHTGDSDEYANQRRRLLAQSLSEVFDPECTEEDNPLTQARRLGDLPFVCMELEPGLTFLMNDLDEFQELRTLLEDMNSSGAREAHKHLRLNLDIAHFLMLGHTVSDLRERGLSDLIGHMHISDHAADKAFGGSHASDLPPGTFHTYADYEEWLEFAVELQSQGKLPSGAIAVEMEACCDPTVVLASISTTRRWLLEAAKDVGGTTSVERAPEGALLNVDLGNSTKALTSQQSPLQTGHVLLETHVAQLCKFVHDNGGSVMSYTGDGIIAFFEKTLFTSNVRAAQAAQLAAQMCCAMIPKGNKVTLRAALHWGTVYIPTSGRLRGEAVGIDVVTVTRVCDWLGKTIEPAKAPDKRHTLIAATQEFVEKLEDAKGTWRLWGKSDQFKGLDEPPTVFMLPQADDE